MDRRTFISWVGLGWVASCFPVALAACSTSETLNPSPSPTPETAASPSPETGAIATADGFQTVGTVADLDQTGYITKPNFAGGDVIVIRDPANSQVLMAVNPTCPHKGCAVEWQADQKEFVCPCHASHFTPDGKVLEGPATAPLKLYTAKIEGDAVRVKA